MSPPSPPDSTGPADDPRTSAIPDASEAGAWIWRIDRGLSPDEQDALFEWLAANPANAEALSRARQYWARLGKLADWRPEYSQQPNPDLLAVPRRAALRRWWAPLSLAAAAVMALLVYVTWPLRETGTPAVAQENRRLLPDASSVRLNTDSAITVRYSPTERRIRLSRGEAFFNVMPEAARPFVVEAGGVDVRAVGTAFNVRLGRSTLDVLVANGTVAVATPARGPSGSAARTSPAEVAVLRAQQRLSLPLTPNAAPATVAPLTRQELQRSLSWQHGLMTFRDETLAAIVAELNRLNDTQMILLDDALGSSRFSGTIRSDNVEGFARLLQSSFGAQIEKSSSDEIHLRTRPE